MRVTVSGRDNGRTSMLHAVADANASPANEKTQRAAGCMSKVENYNVHDSSSVTMRMKIGATATITSSCVCNHGGGVALTIVTPEATVAFSGGTMAVKEGGKTTEYHSRVNMYEEEDKVFIEAVRTGKRTKIKSPYSDALKSFLVTLAANESM
ncbi:MAG: hypothetical protein WCK89_24250, partial [bacterium]